MITDSCFTIGSTHEICQDYCIHGDSYIILSDGCSSSKNTDIGSRLLCLTANSNFITTPTPTPLDECIIQTIIERTSHISSLLNLHPSCLDATLLIVQILEKLYNITVCGDGHVILKKDNTITDYKVEYKKSTPYYPNYLISEFNTLYHKFIENNTPVCSITKTIIVNSIIVETSIEYNNNCVNQFQLNCNDYDLITITSDGLDSFQNIKTCEVINSSEIIPELVNFKIANKNFTKRRLVKMLNDFKNKNIVNGDDLSIATIWN